MGPVRLDEELWTPSALGVVGPGRLQALAAGVEEDYRPLLGVHRDRAPGPDDGSVLLVDGDDDWAAVTGDPQAGPMLAGPLSWLRDHPRAVLVAARVPDGGVRALVAMRPDARVPTLGEVVLAWSPGIDLGGAAAQGLLGRAWLRAFRACALRGLVGLTVGVGSRGARDVALLRRVAGFRPLEQCYAEVGLAPADAGVVLDEWRVTVADDEVTDIGLLAGESEAEQRELMGRILPLVTRPGPDPAPATGPYRTSFGGAITLDGCRGLIGPLPDGDWWEPEPDLDAAAARPRAEWIVGRWVGRQLAGT